MIKRGIPPLLVRVQIYWYTTQTFCVKWGSVTSSYFNVTNGVRQGGILSPYLFTLYVNVKYLGVIMNDECQNTYEIFMPGPMLL